MNINNENDDGEKNNREKGTYALFESDILLIYIHKYILYIRHRACRGGRVMRAMGR